MKKELVINNLSDLCVFGPITKKVKAHENKRVLNRVGLLQKKVTKIVLLYETIDKNEFSCEFFLFITCRIAVVVLVILIFFRNSLSGK